jgi:hypothetical protein
LYDGVDDSILKSVYGTSTSNSEETSFLKKYRWILIASIVVLFLILFFVLRKK